MPIQHYCRLFKSNQNESSPSMTNSRYPRSIQQRQQQKTTKAHNDFIHRKENKTKKEKKFKKRPIFPLIKGFFWTETMEAKQRPLKRANALFIQRDMQMKSTAELNWTIKAYNVIWTIDVWSKNCIIPNRCMHTIKALKHQNIHNRKIHHSKMGPGCVCVLKIDNEMKQKNNRTMRTFWQPCGVWNGT